MTAYRRCCWSGSGLVIWPQVSRVTGWRGLSARCTQCRPPVRRRLCCLPLAEAVEQRFVTAAAEASARSKSELAALAPKIQLARQAAGGLLRSFAGPHVLLHGDLGPRNVVRCQQRGLVAIDPAPCIGDPAYDAAYWAADEREAAGLEQRCHALALPALLDPGRVLGWASVIALTGQEPPPAFPP